MDTPQDEPQLTSQANTTSSCAHCGKPATDCCNDCKDVPRSHSTFYCDSSCREAHWTSHKGTCESLQVRKAFYRAADLLKELWHAFRRASYEIPISKVEVKDGNLLVFTKDRRETVSESRAHVAFRFPWNKIPSGWDTEAISCSLTSWDALAYMHKTIKYFLNGLVSDIETSVTEKTVKLKNKACEVRYIASDGSCNVADNVHHFLSVLRSNGEHYVLDLTGAQYSWYEAAMPLSEYIEERVEPDRITTNPFGSNKALTDLSVAAYFKGQPQNSQAPLRAFRYELEEGLEKSFKSFHRTMLREDPTFTVNKYLKTQGNYFEWDENELWEYLSKLPELDDDEHQHAYRVGTTEKANAKYQKDIITFRRNLEDSRKDALAFKFFF
ncbi:uncharacterized protein K452DRAFT_312965 [Aplosporella prunicola CBS 121167]|uniref:MYND-type domain-containing protein n=1 Tax=Aplosporella prunicola CBS 121167 TaxID=1176127 RepID=A0A6A6B1S1_9PEZI|nr:uncharacterized protein K452DRAFT_312965 [Aplosporella prunicola CBS 121167]KAF2136681.1 hypothetical protein K452DRAFT_312965 [Aplosporella prunicola CBS 121167]